jgi:adenylosuccinate lyase
MMDLGLSTPTATTQVVQRDRHIELICALANIATSLEKFATEVRNLQRPEIGEVQEAFDVEKQVGSSTMAHKRNPIMSEKICGLARVARGFVTPMFESAVLWHERDLTNSSAERFILPHVFLLVDEIVDDGMDVFAALQVYPEAMRRNLDATKGLIMAEPAMLALVERGMGRQEAHEVMRRCSMVAEEKGTTMRDALLKDREASKLLKAKDLDTILDPSRYIGSSEQIVKNVLAEVRGRK